MSAAIYNLEVVASAAKEFRSLPMPVKGRVTAAIDALRYHPRPSGVRKLQGHTGLYRIRVGQYRVIYEVNDQALLVRVTRIRHRRDVYR